MCNEIEAVGFAYHGTGSVTKRLMRVPIKSKKRAEFVQFQTLNHWLYLKMRF